MTLPKVLKSIDRNCESRKKYYKEYIKVKKDSEDHKKAVRNFNASQQRLSTLFKDLHFKQKAIEDIVPEVDKYYKDLNKINSDLEKLKKSRSKDSKKKFTVKEI